MPPYKWISVLGKFEVTEEELTFFRRRDTSAVKGP